MRRGATKLRRGAVPLVLVLALAIAGCGGGGSSGSGATSGGSSATVANDGISSPAAAASGGTVATVAGAPIAKATYEHWLTVTTALEGANAHGAGASGQAPKDQTLGFLITAQWVLAQAAADGIDVSAAAVHKHLEELQHKQFKQPAELRRFLAKAHETQADLLLRVKLELLVAAISRRASAAKSTAAAQRAALTSFQVAFQRKWKAKTNCHAGYVMEDCRQYRGPLSTGAGPGASSSASSSATPAKSSSTRSSPANASSSGSGETYSAPGGLTLSSSAFERNGALPARYTCDGANVSPPLAWQNVPKRTAELVLFAIDVSSSTAEGGIRWVVAGIEPNSGEVKAGSLPPGAVAGRNSAGTVGYAGICPAKGKTHNIEFVLYALSKHVPLASGFAPTLAESEYGGSELASATTYATYTRP
jgi:Raf kinase inhibitor-like YbhB/YbcL family protein